MSVPVATPIVLGPTDQSARGPVAKPVTTPVKSETLLLSPSEKLHRRVTEAQKSADSIFSPVPKNLRMTSRIQALVHAAEATLDTSYYVRIGEKRAQCHGVQTLENLHQEATKEYEALYVAYQYLTAQHKKLLADLTTITQEASKVEELERKKRDAIKAILEADSVDHLAETVTALGIDVAKTNEVPRAVPVLTTATTSP